MEEKIVKRRLHAGEIPDLAVAKKARSEILAELGSMPAPPVSAEERDYFGEELWLNIVSSFRVTLPAEGAKRWPEQPQPADLIAFDDFLVGQYTVWGWRLWMAPAALAALARWERKDPERIEQLAKAMARRKKILRGEKGGKLSVKPEEIREACELYIPEMRILVRRWRDECGRLRRRPTNTEFAVFVTRQAQDEAADYPRFGNETPHFVQFIKDQKDSNFAERVRTGRIEAEGIMYHWIALRTGYSERDVRRKATLPKALPSKA